MGFFSGHQSAMVLCCMVVQASYNPQLIELLPPTFSCRMSRHRGPQQSSAWVCFPDPTFQHPALVCSGGHLLRLGGEGRGQYPVCRSHTVLLPRTVAVFSSHKNEAPPSVSTGLPQTLRSFPDVEAFSLFRSPRVAGATPLPFLFLFPSFSPVLPVKAGIFPFLSLSTACVHGGSGALPFLMYSCCVCGEMNCLCLILWHLDLSVSILFLNKRRIHHFSLFL